jgi:hypothetical protein
MFSRCSGRHIIDILRKGDDNLTDEDLGHMAKVVGGSVVRARAGYMSAGMFHYYCSGVRMAELPVLAVYASYHKDAALQEMHVGFLRQFLVGGSAHPAHDATVCTACYWTICASVTPTCVLLILSGRLLQAPLGPAAPQER